MTPPIRLVTRLGECFEVNPQGKDRADNRDGVLHYFHLTDLVKGRGLRRVSVYRGGPRDFYAPSIAEFDRRIDTVLLNTIRRRFDSGELTFDVPQGATYYKEVLVTPEDFQQQSPASDEEIRQLILHEAYWLSYKYGNRHPVQFDSDTDLEYLGVGVQDIWRNQWVLEQDALLEQSMIQGNGRPKVQLVKMYESRQSTENLAASEHPPSGQQQVAGADADRKFARLAIDEARKSVPENDGKPHPWVGAVVVKDGKVLGTAHRGEVPGNHAEFVALERNLPDVAVAGATVYTTLEPCTTRNPPKIPCVDRLIERRVARVVIGILDPDDRIRGKGQRKLRNAGIETTLFPHDLAMEVEELNREFTRFCEKQSLASQSHSANSLVPTGGLKPLVVPLRYGPSPIHAGKHTMGHHGLIVANHGEPAYDVSILTSEVQIGTSKLKFEGSKPTFTKSDGDAFFVATITESPGRHMLGNRLFDEMRKQQVASITVELIYKDAENHWYKTVGEIERNVSEIGGLSVKYVRQERSRHAS